MVRYDFSEQEEAEISIYLLPPHPGRGYGKTVFFATAPELMIRRRVRRIVARVRTDSERSCRFFLTLGFEEVAGESNARRFIFEQQVVPHSKPSLGLAEQSAVVEALNCGHIAQGPRVRALERQWTAQIGTNGAVAVGSGLAALRLSLLALGVRAGDEVVVPAYSCVALPNAVLALGAYPIFADVCKDAWLISVEDVRGRLTDRTKAEEFAALVREVRTAKRRIGSALISPARSEQANRAEARLSCVAARNLKSGAMLRREDIAYSRSGTGVSPQDAQQLLGKTLCRDLEKGAMLTLQDVVHG